MCGRYSYTSRAFDTQEHFGLATLPEVAAHYNIAPSQWVPIVRSLGESEERIFSLVRWGLVPFWAKDEKIGWKMINARAETVNLKPSFRAAFKYRRCLLPATGYFEWKRKGKKKQPYYFSCPDSELFAFAGIWESWESQAGQHLETCTIITREADDFTRPVHDRMPVIVAPENYSAWLSQKTPLAKVQQLLGAPPLLAMVKFPVSTVVNAPGNDTPECIVPLSQQP